MLTVANLMSFHLSYTHANRLVSESLQALQISECNIPLFVSFEHVKIFTDMHMGEAPQKRNDNQ